MFSQTAFSTNKGLIYSQEALKAIKIGCVNHMWFKVVGCGGFPHEPYYKDEWWFVPLKPGEIIPPEGEIRLELLRGAGVRIKGLVIAHEAPKVLPAPKPGDKEKQKTNTATSSTLLPILEVITAVLGAIFMVFGMILIRAILIDPALIVVLEDGTWLEIMTWYE